MTRPADRHVEPMDWPAVDDAAEREWERSFFRAVNKSVALERARIAEAEAQDAPDDPQDGPGWLVWGLLAFAGVCLAAAVWWAS